MHFLQEPGNEAVAKCVCRKILANIVIIVVANGTQIKQWRVRAYARAIYIIYALHEIMCSLILT